MELIRDLLDFIEKPGDIDLRHGIGDESVEDAFPKFPRRVLLGHLDILLDAGFIDGIRNDASTFGGRDAMWVDIRLTWQGHDFLDNVRNDTVWEKTKNKISSTVGTASVEIVGQVAASFLRQMLGLPG